MRPISSLDLAYVWVNPEHSARSARALMVEHRVMALPVVREGKVVGILPISKLLKLDESTRVEDVMVNQFGAILGSSGARQAARFLNESQMDMAPVVDADGKFLGLLSSSMLLDDLSNSYDPLTQLAWQDRLREWGAQMLGEGHEISILFLDLDDFGIYNKRYGHTVGDKVLRLVVELVQSHLDPRQDVFVRYGGDEFAIGSLRRREGAEELAHHLESEQARLRIEEQDEPVTFSIGVCGGNRTHIRERDHLNAMLDNLINMASKAAQERKLAKKALRPSVEHGVKAATSSPEMESSTGLKLIDVSTGRDGKQATVTLQRGSELFIGVNSEGANQEQTIAIAASRAIERAYPDSSIRILECDASHTQVRCRIEVIQGREMRQQVKVLDSKEAKAADVVRCVLGAFEPN